MHILDLAKKGWIATCPLCKAEVKAYQLTVFTSTTALLFFKCGCGWKTQKRIEPKITVDHIE